MFVSKSKAVVVLWIACLAILMAALAPTLSRALTVARGDTVPSMEICSVAGGLTMVPLKFNGQAPDGPQKTTMSMGDCPCCSMHVATLNVTPMTLAPASGALITGLLPVLFYQSITPLFAWTPVQPRGPPATF
ncbi:MULTISPECIES: DUF2946 domain-containing protein [unclassified Janthinobacterium]|uniref:DUF2946 domain-containing protein n=1 Tax=unclassified Janthinobacterium TaxID=2610881 RepID=UPI001621769E|nr:MULTISPECIES: DUF2946 domain-containing protein [unclassified Janthinobacterium]MBB5369964.1 hypothetical protein [Janthinobacterium sp. K2C7]MBB5382770.1 hypothetical protein [Janthinobacterium sp. K2Li3]MBB5384755.1 hypothetical protein [Janthinobacterium sp. K2E3]